MKQTVWMKPCIQKTATDENSQRSVRKSEICRLIRDEVCMCASEKENFGSDRTTTGLDLLEFLQFLFGKQYHNGRWQLWKWLGWSWNCQRKGENLNPVCTWCNVCPASLQLSLSVLRLIEHMGLFFVCPKVKTLVLGNHFFSTQFICTVNFILCVSRSLDLPSPLRKCFYCFYS